MNIKIQSSGIAGGENTGSCRKYARYLAHENIWKEEHGLVLDQIPLYDRNAVAVSESMAIDSIDRNKSHLHATEAKFFSCIISFSEVEVQSMGESRVERIRSAHTITEKIMDRYAEGFGTEKVKGHRDLLYFYTVHEFREKEGKELVPGLHVHVIVSRKDASNRYKLSPMTTYRSGSNGVIKRGFCRDEFVRDCEAIFDRQFSHRRKVEESYEYCNALAHGSAEEKDRQIARAVEEKHIAEEISAALSARIARLATEAEQTHANILLNEEDRAKVQRDRFWNDYFSYYKPRIADLKRTCQSAFNLYRDAKDKYNIQSSDISEKYDTLKQLYERMDKLEDTILMAKAVPGLLIAIGVVATAADAIPLAILGLVTAVVSTPISRVAKDIAIAIKKDLRSQAADIREELIDLRAKQAKLKDLKNNSLKDYIKAKEDKVDLQKHLDSLKTELEKPLERKGAAIDLDKRNETYRKDTEVQRKTISGDSVGLFYRALFLSKDKAELDLRLQEYGIEISELVHPNGGVGNLKIASENETRVIDDSLKIKEILDRWELMTGHLPAYKVKELEQNQVIRRKGPKL